jgi:hypothetical protein
MVKPQKNSSLKTGADANSKGQSVSLCTSCKVFGRSHRTQILALCCLVVIALIVYFSIPTVPPNLLQLETQVSKLKSTNHCQWRPEPLQGICDVTKSTIESKVYQSALDCENACCSNANCITFQYREKEGCLWGADSRLGAEKDGVSAWCEPRPPAQWHGQRILDKETGVAVPGACTDAGWKKHELGGQCFGLGSKRVTPLNTPESCRDTCCQDPNCGMWQWRIDAGCFYNKGGFNCQEANPLDFQKFIGKRKVQPGRLYQPYAYTEDFADLAGLENL